MNWKSILTTSLVTCLVTVLAGMILYWVQKETSELVYTSATSISFPVDEREMFINTITVINSGDKKVSDVSIVVDPLNSNIERYEVDASSEFDLDTFQDNDFLKIKAPYLNSTEEFRISLLLVNDKGILDVPQVNVRANGVTGKYLEAEPGIKSVNDFLQIGVAIITVCVASLALTDLLRKKLGIGRNSSEGGMLSKGAFYRGAWQTDVIASFLAINGLSDLSQDYLRRSKKTKYWSESDVLTAYALSSADEKIMNGVLGTLVAISKLDHVEKTSKAIIKINIGKILKHLGREAESEEYFASTQELDQDLLSERIQNLESK